MSNYYANAMNRKMPALAPAAPRGAAGQGFGPNSLKRNSQLKILIIGYVVDFFSGLGE